MNKEKKKKRVINNSMDGRSFCNRKLKRTKEKRKTLSSGLVRFQESLARFTVLPPEEAQDQAMLCGLQLLRLSPELPEQEEESQGVLPKPKEIEGGIQEPLLSGAGFRDEARIVFVHVESPEEIADPLDHVQIAHLQPETGLSRELGTEEGDSRGLRWRPGSRRGPGIRCLTELREGIRSRAGEPGFRTGAAGEESVSVGRRCLALHSCVHGMHGMRTGRSSRGCRPWMLLGGGAGEGRHSGASRIASEPEDRTGGRALVERSRVCHGEGGALGQTSRAPRLQAGRTGMEMILSCLSETRTRRTIHRIEMAGLSQGTREL